jgi:polyhydroxyalkanoate synthesis regulator phasin
MKVKIKDLYPNPYRDMDNYPINRVKVDALKASIKQTGFWDNIVARNKDGQVQIAYGHHRLTALREALSWDTEVDIPIKDLPDSTMIQIMANENMQEYSTSPATIDETVRVAKKFLEENPEVLSGVFGGRPQEKFGAPTIAKFLNWPESRINFSLQRLNLIESGKVSREAINQLPTDNAARSFTKAAVKWDLEPEKQDRIIREIVDGGNMGYDQIERKVSEAKFQNKPKERKEEHEKEQSTLQFNNYVIAVHNKSVDLLRQLDVLIEHKEQFNYLSMKDVKDASTRLSVLQSLKKLAGRINTLLTQIEHEYNAD